jgi:hypothetical protein
VIFSCRLRLLGRACTTLTATKQAWIIASNYRLEDNSRFSLAEYSQIAWLLAGNSYKE